MDKKSLMSFVLGAFFVAALWVYANSVKELKIAESPGQSQAGAPAAAENTPAAEKNSNPPSTAKNSDEILLPVRWEDLGSQMVKSGVIDADKFEAVYQARGGLNAEEKNLLYGKQNGQLKINSRNAGYLLNLFWALGLGNKNEILENGEMADPRYGNVGNFASTGGWTIAQGNATEHYSRHNFVVLSPDQQNLVARVSRNIYRPCCSNSTHFPDCNHGMAMLGLLELMARQGVAENQMYAVALAVNSYWFPDTYQTIAAYLKNKGLELGNMNPKELLGADYSSAAGYQRIAAQVPASNGSTGGCGVESGKPIPQPQQPRCGI